MSLMNTDVNRLILPAAAEPPAQTSASAPFNPDKLPTDPVVLQRMIAELVAVMQKLRQENSVLQQHLDELSRRLRGIRPERCDPNQPLLFPELQASAAPSAEPAPAANGLAEPATAEAEQEPAKKKKKGHGRRRLEDLLPHLPAQRREYPLTEAERICPCCGKPRGKIGEQTTQQLEYEPAKFVRVEHVQFTYSCPQCPEHIITAPKPPQPIDRGLPGPKLLAAIITNKYDEHQPLYRLELTLWRSGVFLTRSTTCTWMAAVAELLRPLVERMKAQVMQSRVIQTDSTGVSVLIEGRADAQTGQLWEYLGDKDHPYVVFDFSVDHTKGHPQKFLAGYTGYVQADAYAGYDGLFVPDSVHPKIEVGCWAHAERKIEEARATEPALACQALGFTSALFAIEKRARHANRAEAEVLQLRQRESVPILAEFKTWLDAAVEQALPKSPLGEALGYVHNQWQALNRYTEAGFLEMTNNASERINKIIAIGRRNWLFVGSPQGGQTAATLFSVTATCRRLQMDAFAYLGDVLTRLPTHPPERLDELLPDRWLAAHPEARWPPERCRQAAEHKRPPP
jgi:transposase